MSFLNKKKITSRARRRQPEYKRRFFKNKTKLVGPKIYLSTRHRSKLAVSSSFWPKIYLIIFCFLALGLCYLFFGLKFWQVSEINFDFKESIVKQEFMKINNLKEDDKVVITNA